MSVKLYDALKSSYGDKKSKKNLEKAGYIKNNKLSNHNQSVYYNPAENKTMVNVAGTHNLKDVVNDVYLAFGGLKKTDRYKQAKNTLEKAKNEYNGSDVIITGHSLGGSISQKIGGKNDKVYSLNSGYTIGSKTKGDKQNQNNYRVVGDVVSLLSSGAKNINTIKNKNEATGFIGTDILKSHNVENIKNSNIYV